MGFLDKLRRFDRLWIGIIIGIGLPLLLYPIIRPLDPEKYKHMLTSYRQVMLKLLPVLLSRCIFPNALIFFLLIWNNFNNTAKGVLYATAGLTLILIALRIIF